jgi:hypothetical protein
MKPTLAACSSDLRTDVDARGKPAAGDAGCRRPAFALRRACAINEIAPDNRRDVKVGRAKQPIVAMHESLVGTKRTFQRAAAAHYFDFNFAI